MYHKLKPSRLLSLPSLIRVLLCGSILTSCLYSFRILSVFTFCTTAKESSGTIPESKESSFRGKEWGRESEIVHVATTNKKIKILCNFFFKYIYSPKKPAQETWLHPRYYSGCACSVVQERSFTICVTLRTLDSTSVS